MPNQASALRRLGRWFSHRCQVGRGSGEDRERRIRWELLGLGASPLVERIARAHVLARVVERRRRNFFHLLGALRGVAPPLVSELPSGVCPLFYPLWVPDRDEALARLRAENVEANEGWRSFHPRCDGNEFPDAARLRDHLVELPCHQDLGPAHVAHVARAASARCGKTGRTTRAPPRAEGPARDGYRTPGNVVPGGAALTGGGPGVNERDVFAVGPAYEGYIGRWSRPVAREFVRWLDVPARRRWLDVGCGTGALTEIVVEVGEARSVVGVDPSAGFVQHARARTFDTAEVQFLVGDALGLPVGSVDFDVVVSGLVLGKSFTPHRTLSLRERDSLQSPHSLIS